MEANVVPSAQSPLAGVGAQPQTVPGGAGGGEGGGGPGQAFITTEEDWSSKPTGTVQVNVKLVTPLGGSVTFPTLKIFPRPAVPLKANGGFSEDRAGPRTVTWTFGAALMVALNTADPGIRGIFHRLRVMVALNWDEAKESGRHAYRQQ